MISLDTLTLTLIVGTAVPLVVALVTKAHASEGVKAIANVVLTAIGGAGSALLVSPDGLPWQQVVIAAFATYVASGSSYAHGWKPLGIAPALAAATADVGIGGPPGGKHAAA